MRGESICRTRRKPAMLEARTRDRLIIACALAAALFLGVRIAEGELSPALGAAALAALVVLRLRLVPDVLTAVLGGLLFGYLVGNRGFAQQIPLPGLPVLFAEMGLGIGAVILFVRTALERRLPWRFDALNLALLAWIVVSSVRLPLDVRLHGFAALRDYALVYYAGFFFLAQEVARREAGRRWLHGAWVAASIALLVAYPLHEVAPHFFYETLTWRGVPWIAIKADLAGTFAAAAALYAAVRWGAGGGRRWALLTVASLGLAGYVVSRAGFVGMAVVCVLMPRGRAQLGLAALLLVILGVLVSLPPVMTGHKAWRETRLYDVYEHVVSIGDVTGSRAYRGDLSSDTGDNTRFRLVWWRMVVKKTLAENPLTGAGFGADITEAFVREYFGLAERDFNARSPHNVLLTVFGRTGLIGALAFIAFVTALGRQAWRTTRVARTQVAAIPAAALGCAASVIFVSACFGVVLEGPMGAVVFWTLLGLAHGWSQMLLAETPGRETAGSDPGARDVSDPSGITRPTGAGHALHVAR